MLIGYNGATVDRCLADRSDDHAGDGNRRIVDVRRMVEYFPRTRTRNLGSDLGRPDQIAVLAGWQRIRSVIDGLSLGYFWSLFFAGHRCTI
ncbi:MAG: hypothetical protein ACLP5H_00240 [Desulfomonilaceae bacterium]